MKNLYIHIGTPKTGTTTIQKFLSSNREILLNKGIYYPKFPFEWEDALGTDGNFGWWAHGGMDYKTKVGIINDLFIEHDNVLLSSEDIWLEEPDKIKFLKELCPDKYNIKVIVYLRKQIEYLESQYREIIRVWQEKEDMGKICSSNNPVVSAIMATLDYCSVLDNMESVIGKDNIIVRPYEKQQFVDENIVHDFLKCLGIEAYDDFIFYKTKYNPAMDNAVLKVKTAMNKSKEYNQNDMLGCFYTILRVDGSVENSENKNRSLIPYAIRRFFMDRYIDSNKKIAHKYLGRNDGCLFYEDISSEEAEVISTDRVLEKSITIATSALLIAYRQRQELRNRLNSMEERLKRLETGLT